MTTTPNYGFKIAEGTDTVNLLTQSYPNFTDLDTILKSIELTGITSAVATKVGTVFNVVRTNTSLNVLKFVATANYASGDTFTIDGVSVTATAVDGTSLPAGAFVINQTVVALLNGTVLTVLVSGGLQGPIDADDVVYDNTLSGLAATDVQAAIDEVKGDIPAGFAATAITYDNTVSGLAATDVQDAIDELAANAGSVSVTGDGVKTISTLLNELYALIDSSKLSTKSSMNVQMDNVNYVFVPTVYNTASYEFSCCRIDSAGYWLKSLVIKSASSLYAQHGSAGYTNSSNSVVPVGKTIELIY